ncbi:MAG: hypothetical protein KAJ64_00680, partial [Thermoplasmata archaeon]|nr:hypothetical protein [Thermoplasmata archaeon]
ELWGKDNHPITEYYADKPIHTEEKVTGTDAAWSWDFGDFPDTNVIALNNSDNSRVFGVTYDSDDYPADTITDSRIFVQTWDFSRIEDTATQAQYTYKAIMWLGNITMKYTQDIAISEQTIYPKSVFFKQNVTISFVVRNNGFAPYNFSQGDNLWYLLRITDMNGNDLIVPHLERIDYLGVGVNNTLTLSYSWTPEQIGYHRIVIKVDPYNYIEESNELNNEISSYLASGELFVQYRILVVDDDGSPNNGGIFVNETLEVETAMEYLNATGLYRYENYTVNVGSDGPAFAPGTNGAGLSEYNAVIWVGGEELDPLTAMDMLNITYYLDIGGNFWLIGNGLWTDADEVVDMDFERDYLKISSVDGNQDMASVLWGRTDDYVSHGMQYEYNGDPDADILVPVIDIVEPENSGIGFTYQNNATTRFNSVRYEGNPITNTTITYRAATTPWLLSSLDSNDSRNEFIFMMLRWFDKPENRIEARINDVDLWISDDHPQLGSGYVIQATVHNTGGASGNVLVRFMDGNTQIGSQSVTVAPGGKTTAEMIWVPLFAGPRTITILLDPIAEVDEIFEWSNNNATINTIVYFFWDDMESGTSKWSHSSTVLLINGEDALEYFHDTVLDTNIISEWNYTQSQNITNCTDLTFYYSHDTSYWFQEPEGNASGSSSNETRASTGGEKVLYTEIFYETFPNADGTWDGSADTAQNELGWDTAQGLGDNDVRVEDIDIAAGTIPPSGNNHLTFNDADQGAAPANPNDWAWVQIDLSGYTNCTLEYYWQDQASDAGEGGRVDYSTNAIDGSSGTWTNINTHINQDENDWYRETFVIPDIAAVATFSLRLSAYSNQNQENFLFDDIKIYINIRPDIPTFISHGANTTALGGETADETPSLNWNYSDIDGDLQQYYDVRVYDDATGIMTWSSGIIASPDHNVSVGDVGVPLGATLTNGEKYYWECLVSDGYAWSSIGGGNDTWEFTVNVSVNMPPDLPFNPSPTDWSGGAPTNLDLFWQCNDPDNDTLSYDVYLDLVNPPIAQVAAGLINITSLSQSLEPDTIYFWYVVVSDPYNAPVIGDIWVFATTGAGGGGVGVNWSALGRATDTININKTAVTQTMDLSNLESAKLSFWHKYSLLTGLNGAFLQVGYRDDTIDSDGDLDPTNDWDWKYITPSNAYTGNLNSSDWVEDDFGTRVYWCWNGVSARGTFGWDYIQVNLLNYVPEADRDEVRVKFNYIQWGEGTGYGWYIDDVRVTVSRSNSINPDSSTQDIWNYTTADAHSGNYSWSNVDPDTGLVKPGIDNYLMTTPIDLTNA